MSSTPVNAEPAAALANAVEKVDLNKADEDGDDDDDDDTTTTGDAASSAAAKSKNAKKKAKAKAKKAAAAAAAAAGGDEKTEVKAEQKENKQNEDGESDDDEEGEGDAAGGADGDKKKKKKKKKKKAGGSAAAGLPDHITFLHLQVPSKFAEKNDPEGVRRYNSTNIQPVKKQTSPCTVPVMDMYKDHDYPLGQIVNHPGDFNTFRTTSEEKKAAEKINETQVTQLREAAEVHRQVRQDFMRWVKPGMNMIDIVQYIEKGTSTLLKAKGIERGFGFPTGCSLNHVAAHYTPNYKDTTVLQQGDVMKIDFGTQVGGHIIDSAFTVAFDHRYDALLRAVKDSNDCGLRTAGIDVRLTDIGEAIQEVMESYEITLNGTTYPIKCIRNLNGHNIAPWRIHGGKSVPIVKNGDNTKMEEGELYAIETFGSTGRGLIIEDGDCSHYMKSEVTDFRNLRLPAAKKVLAHIDQHHGTLPFCRRWLDDQGCTQHLMGLKALCDAGIVNAYPPLVEPKGSYTAQFEHTFICRPTCKEILSRGDDY